MCGSTMARAALRCAGCKVAHDRERLRAWRAENPEKRKEQGRRNAGARYRRNPEATKARAVAWQQENREAYNERLRQWRDANPERAAAIARKHRQANPDAVRERTRRRHATLRSVTVERVDYAAIAERDGWTCHLCELPVDPTIRGRVRDARSFDHVIPLALGGEHSTANIRLAHFGCNSRKGARTLERAA